MTDLMRHRGVTPDDVRKINNNGNIDSIVPSGVSIVEMTGASNETLTKRGVSPKQIQVFDYAVNVEIFNIGLKVLRAIFS